MSKQTATIEIKDKEFSCVKLSDADFKDIAAIYVILCVDKDGNAEILDVGQTGELGDRIDGHKRKKCWEDNCKEGTIWVCVYPMPSKDYTKQDRIDLEKEIRDDNDPPCGKR